MFEERKRNKYLLLAAAYTLTGLLIRIYYLYQFSDSPLFAIPIGPDVEEYTKWANEILAGKYLWTNVNIHSPLYPYFLALLCRIFSSAKNIFGYIRFTQLFIGLISVIPLYLSLKILLDNGKDEKKSFISDRITKFSFLFIWLSYPPLIFYMGELTSEVLIVPLLSLSIFYLYKSEEAEEVIPPPEDDSSHKNSPLRKNRIIPHKSLAGLYAGLAVTAHPLSLFFLILETLYISISLFINKKKSNSRKKITAFLLFILFALIPIIPIVIYNTIILKESAPLQANSGFNFYLGNGPDADGTCRIRPGPEWDKVHSEAQQKADALGISKDKYFIKTTFSYIAEHPLHWLKLLSMKALYVWNEKELTAGADILPLRYFTPFQRHSRWAFGLLALLAIIAIIINAGPDLNGKGKNTFFYKYRHFLILIIAFWTAQTLLVTSGRYRMGMLPAVMLLASAGISSIFYLLRNRNKRTLMLIPALLIAVTVVYLPSPPYHPAIEIAEAQTIFGEALIRKKLYSEAKGQLISAAKHQPGWSRNYNLLGLISEKEENFDEAEQYYRQAIKSSPDTPDGYVNIATLYSNRGLTERARTWFKKALALRKETPELYYNYALYCAKNGDNSRAVKYYQACIKLDPANSEALNNLGTIYFQKNNLQEAIVCFKTALRVDPHNPQRMLNLALTYLKNGDKKNARKILAEALKTAPKLPALHTLQLMIDQKE
jgi:Flp pilus assembly protein TadD